MDLDPLIIAGRSFQSRLFIGTGKFPSTQALRETIAASGSEIVTDACFASHTLTPPPGHEINVPALPRILSKAHNTNSLMLDM